MKKKFTILLLAMVAIVTATMLVSCGDDDFTTHDDFAITYSATSTSGDITAVKTEIANFNKTYNSELQATAIAGFIANVSEHDSRCKELVKSYSNQGLIIIAQLVNSKGTVVDSDCIQIWK